MTLHGGGVAISVGPAIQAFTDNEVIVSFCGHLSNVDYLAWRLFSPEGRRGDKAPAQGSLEAAKKLNCLPHVLPAGEQTGRILRGDQSVGQ